MHVQPYYGLTWFSDVVSAIGPTEREVLSPHGTDVIIPVCDGFEFLGPLFDSIRQNTKTPYRLIVVDDASSDGRVRPFLEDVISGLPGSRLLCHESRRGFSASVNEAAELVEAGVFVILNSDTEVPPEWLGRIRAPIDSNPNIASVTPISNCATIASFPKPCVENPIFLGKSVSEVDSIFSGLNAECVVSPTGVGFCLAINASVWEAIGGFDAIAFPEGYGEENDWCMRAKSRGFDNVILPTLFVYHYGGGSFPDPERRRMRLEENYGRLIERHPSYESLVGEFTQRDPLGRYRIAAVIRALKMFPDIRQTLIVDHDIGGGAKLYSDYLIDQRLSRGEIVIILTHTRLRDLAPIFVVCIRCDSFGPISFMADYNDISLLLKNHASLSEIVLNNLVAFKNPLEILGLLISVETSSNARFVFPVHDYFCICPNYTLINHEGVFCGLPADNECSKCLKHNRSHSCVPRISSILGWRRSWNAAFDAMDEIMCISECSRQLLQRAYPKLHDRILVRPYPNIFTFKRAPKLPVRQSLTIGVLGNINFSKGLDVIASLASHIEANHPDSKIVVFGNLLQPPKSENIIVTGGYDRSGLCDLIEEYGANVFFFSSIWPETFSYVTSELMNLNVPLACFDIGAPAERVASYAKGSVIPISSAPEEIYQALVSLNETHNLRGQTEGISCEKV
jgi:O-antigen biosynthesis protein